MWQDKNNNLTNLLINYCASVTDKIPFTKNESVKNLPWFSLF